MTVKDVCIGLYNISLKLDCVPYNMRQCRRVCPDKKSLEELCYLYDRRDKILSDNYELQIDKNDGKLKVCPELTGLTMCQNVQWKELEVVHFPKENVDSELKEFDQLLPTQKGNLVQLISMLETTVVMYQRQEIGMLDMFLAFGVNDAGDGLNTDMLMEKFWNMVYLLMDEIAKGRANEEVMKALTTFLQSLEKIYADRDRLCQQFQAYMDEISFGLERSNYRDEFKDLREKIIEEKYRCKREAENGFEFLFSPEGKRHPYGAAFSELATVLKVFLEKFNLHKKVFQKEIFDEFLGCLEKFA